MIGDILMAYLDDGETQSSFPVKVDGLDENYTLVDGECCISWKPMLSSDSNEEYADELNPLPLTAEILEKNGFERKVISDEEPYYQDKEGNSYYQYGELGINTPNIWFWYKDGHITMPSNCAKWIEFSSVHELQHALRLCELTELADNFKV